MKLPIAIVITCEHGGNRVPASLATAFRRHAAVLDTHRGYDIGAARVAKAVATAFGAPLFLASTTRLVVDLNRSMSHPKLFSEMTRNLSKDEKERILAEHYVPHRSAVESAVRRERQRGRFVLHLGIHSFTPVLNGVKRRADIGLLYDPARPKERAFCAAWTDELTRANPEFVTRKNYPYRGTSDGFSTALRRQHAATGYAGIEVEINQRLFESERDARHVTDALILALGRQSSLPLKRR